VPVSGALCRVEASWRRRVSSSAVLLLPPLTPEQQTIRFRAHFVVAPEHFSGPSFVRNESLLNGEHAMNGPKFARYAKAVMLSVLVAATLGALVVATMLHFVPVVNNAQWRSPDDLMVWFQGMSISDVQAIYHSLKASTRGIIAWVAGDSWS